jgi:hypothetical protein
VVADQDAIDPGPRRHPNHALSLEFMVEPQRPPARMLAAQLTHLGLDLDRGLVRTGPGAMGAVLQPSQTLGSIAAQPAMDRLATHPIAVGHLSDRHAAQHLGDGGVALLDHAQLPQHMASLAAAAKPPAQKDPAAVSSISRDTGNHQPRPTRQASSEPAHADGFRLVTTSSTLLKAGQRAA